MHCDGPTVHGWVNTPFKHTEVKLSLARSQHRLHEKTRLGGRGGKATTIGFREAESPVSVKPSGKKRGDFDV